MHFVYGELLEAQKYFLKDQINGLYWANVMEISMKYPVEALYYFVLEYSNTNTGRFETEFETHESVVKLAYENLFPKKEAVTDLCSGVGSFLTYSAQKSIDKNDGYSFYGVKIHTQY